VFEWDEAKREANLVKHGVDFVDALSTDFRRQAFACAADGLLRRGGLGKPLARAARTANLMVGDGYSGPA
jgi:hypothetical protein